MITKITMHDEEQGDFVYERDEQDAFRWHLRVPHADGTVSDRLAVKTDGRDVAWQCAIAAQQGVET